VPPPFVPAAAAAAGWSGRGVIQNKHSSDVESPPFPHVRAFTLEVCRAPISLECLFSMTLLHGGGGGGAHDPMEQEPPRRVEDWLREDDPFRADFEAMCTLQRTVGRCRLAVSKSVLKAPMVSALETRIS